MPKGSKTHAIRADYCQDQILMDAVDRESIAAIARVLLLRAEGIPRDYLLGNRTVPSQPWGAVRPDCMM